MLAEGQRLADVDYEGQLSMLARAETPEAMQEQIRELKNEIAELRKHHGDEKLLLEDKVRFVEKERDQLKE